MQATDTAGRVGPNAIIQTGAALSALVGPGKCGEIFGRAGLAGYLSAPPDEMVLEGEARALFSAIAGSVSEPEAARLLAEAGRRTGDYILAHRIPEPAQKLLRRLPVMISSRLLLAAIGRHAWTFVGSGRVECGFGSPLTLTITPNALATPGCPWHQAVFTRLFQDIVSSQTRVRHTSCCARGGAACRFELSFGP